MIQGEIVKMLKAEMPGVTWSENYYTLNDNVGAVYTHAGRGPTRDEGHIIRPLYQVLIRSSDQDKAETYAYQTQELLHKMQNVKMQCFLYLNDEPAYQYDVNVLLLDNVGGIHYLGVDEREVAEYSINFDATIDIINKEAIT